MSAVEQGEEETRDEQETSGRREVAQEEETPSAAGPSARSSGSVKWFSVTKGAAPPIQKQKVQAT